MVSILSSEHLFPTVPYFQNIITASKKMHQCWDSFDLALDILATRKERLATNTNIMKKVEQLLYVTNHYYEVLEKANKIFGMQ